MHINVISNGMGRQSMYMIVLAAEGKIDSTLALTGDTGSENDCLWNTGRRTTSYEYFDEVMIPYGKANGIEVKMVKAVNRNKEPLTPIFTLLEQGITAGVPFYGSRGGQNNQHCTGKWKIRAVRQELRRRGAKTATAFIGYTLDEVHRMKPSDVIWCQNEWPLINDRIYRATVAEELAKRNIPYLISSECDHCPHKNRARWERTSDNMIDRLAKIEDGFPGLYFTPTRIPLRDAIKEMNLQPSLYDGCDEGYCFV